MSMCDTLVHARTCATPAERHASTGALAHLCSGFLFRCVPVFIAQASPHRRTHVVSCVHIHSGTGH
eukprot:418601-Pelagomonas_calceolata.AAC.2